MAVLQLFAVVFGRESHGIADLPNDQSPLDFNDFDLNAFNPAAPPIRGGPYAPGPAFGVPSPAIPGADDAEFAAILRIQADLRAKKALVARQHAIIVESEASLKKYR